MSMRYPGGLIIKNPVTPAGPDQAGAAPGVWTMDQALGYIKQGVWPTAGVTSSFLGQIRSPTDMAMYGVATDTTSSVIFVTGIYVMKYAASGASTWSYKFPSGVNLYGVTTDSSNNIYVVGSSGNNGFIAQLNSSGTIQWQKTQNPGTSTAGYARNVIWRSVRIDTSGNVIVAGVYNDNVNYVVCTCCGPVNVKYNIGYTAAAKYNSAGTFQWGRKFGVTSMGVPTTSQGAYGVALDSSNNLYVSGTSKNSTGALTMSVLKYNSSGVQQWGYMYKNDTYTTTQDQGIICADSSGNCYITSATISGPAGIFKINSSGTFQWGKNFTPNTYGIAIDPSGTDFYVAGGTSIGSPYYNEFILAKISSAGSLQFVRSLGSTDSAGVAEQANSLAVSPDSNMVFGGPTRTTSAFSLTGKLKTTGAGLGTYTVGNSYTYATNASTLTAQNFTTTAATATQYSASSDTALVVTEATSSHTLTSQAQTYYSTVVA